MRAILNELKVEYVEQYPIRGGFILDFAIPLQRIAIETDGAIWHRKWYDNWRDRKLGERGWTAIHFGEEFTIKEVRDKLEEVVNDGR